jgi:hypothetical protein
MSDIIVEIIEPTNNIIEIDTNLLVNDNITIEISETNTIEIVNTEKLLASDFPDFYHTKIIDFDSAVSGLLPSGVSIEDVQDIIGNSGIIAGTGLQIIYNDSTGLTTINASGLTIGSTVMNLGNSYNSLYGLSSISGLNISSPTYLINCRIDGGTP